MCQDFAHLAIGAMRSLGLPARYVSGYIENEPPPGEPKLVGADASHAWCSVYIPGWGWLDVDPTNDKAPPMTHVTVGLGARLQRRGTGARRGVRLAGDAGAVRCGRSLAGAEARRRSYDLSMGIITACTLDCPDSCSLEATVEDGKLVALDAAPERSEPEHRWLDLRQGQAHSAAAARCRSHHRAFASRRVRRARASSSRSAGTRRSTSLPIGSRRAASEHGWSSVVPYLYSSSAGNLGRAGLSPLVWEHFGAARTDITICAAVVGEAWDRTYGSMASADPADLEFSNLIVVWGANPNVSHPHLSPVIEARRRAGAKVVVVDPRRTPIAARSDLHLAVRPGTDGVLAMAVAALLQRNGHLDRAFIDEWVDGADEYLAACAEWTVDRAADVCGLDAADIEQFAEMYGTIRPAMLRVGWGQERNRNGGSASRAVFALPALAGQFGVPGSGVFNSISGGAGLRRRGRSTRCRRRRAGARASADQHEPARSHPDRRRRWTRRGALRAGLQSGSNLPRAGHRAGGPRAVTTCSRSSTT